MPTPSKIRVERVLTRYWFEFDWGEMPQLRAEGLGCGVTAFDREDALGLLSEVFADSEVPPVKHVTEDVDIQTLDQGHVLPNMGVPSERGVWFPNYRSEAPTPGERDLGKRPRNVPLRKRQAV